VLKKAEKALIAFCVCAIALIMNANVIMRYVFNRSWTPTEEMCLILVVIVTFVGSAHATRMGMHLFASLIFDVPLIPLKIKRFLTIIIHAVCSALCSWLTILALQFVRQNYISHRTTPSLGIPFYTFYCVLPLAFALMAWQNARTAVLNLKMKESFVISPEREDE